MWEGSRGCEEERKGEDGFGKVEIGGGTCERELERRDLVSRALHAQDVSFELAIYREQREWERERGRTATRRCVCARALERRVAHHRVEVHRHVLLRVEAARATATALAEDLHPSRRRRKVEEERRPGLDRRQAKLAARARRGLAVGPGVAVVAAAVPARAGWADMPHRRARLARREREGRREGLVRAVASCARRPRRRRAGAHVVTLKLSGRAQRAVREVAVVRGLEVGPRPGHAPDAESCPSARVRRSQDGRIARVRHPAPALERSERVRMRKAMLVDGRKGASEGRASWSVSLVVVGEVGVGRGRAGVTARGARVAARARKGCVAAASVVSHGGAGGLARVG